MTKGDILFVEKFRFPDGQVVPKLFIVLNAPKPDEPLLLVLTTSQRHEKLEREGCHSARGYYVFRSGVDYFVEERTWVLFRTMEEFLSNRLASFKAQFNPQVKATLKPENYRALANCIANDKTVLPFYQKLIRAV